MDKRRFMALVLSSLLAAPAIVAMAAPDSFQGRLDAAYRAAGQAFVSGKPVASEAPDAGLAALQGLVKLEPPAARAGAAARLDSFATLRRQAIGVQEGRDPADDPSIHVAAIELVAERLKVDKKRAVALYRARVRAAGQGPGKSRAVMLLEADAVRRLLKEGPRNEREHRRLMDKAARLSAALGGLAGPQDDVGGPGAAGHAGGLNGAVDGRGGAAGQAYGFYPEDLPGLKARPIPAPGQPGAAPCPSGGSCGPAGAGTGGDGAGTGPGGAGGGGKTPASKGWRLKAVEWLKGKGGQWYQDASKYGEMDLEGFQKFGTEAGGIGMLVAGHVLDRAPQWGEAAAGFGRRLASGEGAAYKEAALGTGRFVKNAVVGIWTGMKDAGGAWGEFGSSRTTTYQGLKATALTVLAISDVVPTGKGKLAKTAVKAGLEQAAEATGKQTVRRVVRQGVKEGVGEGVEAAVRRPTAGTAALAAKRRAGGGSMLAAVVRDADDLAADAGRSADDIARRTRGGAAWFKDSVRESPVTGAAKGGAGVPGPKPLGELEGRYRQVLAAMDSASDPAERAALEARKTAVFAEYKAAQMLDAPEFARIRDMNVPAEQKRRLLQSLVETQVHPSQRDTALKVGEHLVAALPDRPAARPDFADLAGAQVLEGRLLSQNAGGNPVLKSADDVRKAYRQTLNGPASYEHAFDEVWFQAARGGDGEFIQTAGGQFMRRQTRGTCPWHTTCNLFNADIQEGRLSTKELLGLAYEYNPHFASRSAQKGITENGLKAPQLRELVETAAGRAGKASVPVAPEDLVRYMRETREPVLVMVTTGKGSHVMLVGNPFTMPGPNNATRVVFQTFDGNNPTGVAGYIDAVTLGQLMKGDGIGVVPKGHPLATTGKPF